MKHWISFFVLMIGLNFSIQAQTETGNPPGGRLQAYKVAYITKKIDLSPEEAQKFWPVYNKYQEELRSARMAKRQNKDNEIESEEKMLNIRKKYNTEFGKIISAEKVNGLFKAEKDFAVMVQKEFMERRKSN